MGTETSTSNLSDSTLIHGTSTNTLKLLCNGYIRNIDLQLHPNHIPSSIYYLCYKFYHHYNYIIYLSKHDIRITDLDKQHNNNSNKSAQCNVFPLNNQTYPQWDIVNAGIHYEKHFALPNEIRQQIPNGHYEHEFDCMFKCGGRVSSSQPPTNTSMAIILHPMNITQGYYWQLPSLPHATCGNFGLYSNKYGLLSIGGETHDPSNGSSTLCASVVHLQFDYDCHSDVDWKWNECMKLNQEIYQTSAVWIDEDNMAVIAGRCGTAKSTAAIYNVQNKTCVKMNDINVARYGAGIYYDTICSRIYVGGGCQFGSALNSIEYYDVHRNTKWYKSLPNTNLSHDYYPIIWSDLNHSLLYIASVNANGMESIDLRTNSRSWTVVYSQEVHQDGNTRARLLEDLLGTQFADPNIQACRLLK